MGWFAILKVLDVKAMNNKISNELYKKMEVRKKGDKIIGRRKGRKRESISIDTKIHNKSLFRTSR